MNKLTPLRIFLLATILISKISLANEITIQVIGAGKVNVSDAEQSCTDSCNIDTSQSDIKLKPAADDGWYFNAWLDQKCDWGDEVLIAEQNSKISKTGGGAKTLTTLDINNDGIDDLIGISLFDGKISAYINQGDGSFEASQIDIGLVYPSALDSIDWDNDNDIDLLVADYGASKIKLYLNDGNGEFVFSKDFTFQSTRPYAFAVADYNNDNSLDFIISSFQSDRSGDLSTLVNSISSAKLSWFINEEDAFVEQNIISETAAITIDTYQSSTDLYPQIVTAEIAARQVVLYTADNSGIYYQSVIDSVSAIYGVAFGDIDQNGYIDILATNYRPSVISLYYGQADNTFSAATIIDQPVEGVSATSFGDYNNDTYLDVAIGEFNAQKFYYYKTKSFKNCIVKQSTSIALTAEFKQKSQPVIPEPPAKNTPASSGGGATSFYFILLISLRLFIRK
ncbi:MAG: VCBS repeat-containing protein [Colwellia sp.]|nr:VCBS repeat-containing protein [Colwellia sp.]